MLLKQKETMGCGKKKKGNKPLSQKDREFDG